MALFWHCPKTLKSSLAPPCLCLCCYYEVWCGDWVKLVTSCWSKIFPTCPNYPMQSITLNVIRGKVTPEQVHREYPSDSLHPISNVTHPLAVVQNVTHGTGGCFHSEQRAPPSAWYNQLDGADRGRSSSRGSTLPTITHQPPVDQLIPLYALHPNNPLLLHLCWPFYNPASSSSWST